METLPAWYMLTIVFILGAIIGSFLDVLVSRLHTGRSINGRSHCTSCGHTLSWYELVPFVSYIVLRGQCMNCSARIPLRLLALELCTGTAFAFVYLHTANVPSLVLGLCLVSVLIAIALYDLQHLIIPHEFVFGVLLLAIAHLILAAAPAFDVMFIVMHVVSAIAAFAFFWGLWTVSRGTWIGFGDAKLAFVLALMLSLPEMFSFIVFSFWIGASVSLVLLGIQKIIRSGKRGLPILHSPLTMKSEVPFAPFMIAAFLLVYFTQASALAVLTGF